MEKYIYPSVAASRVADLGGEVVVVVLMLVVAVEALRKSSQPTSQPANPTRPCSYVVAANHNLLSA